VAKVKTAVLSAVLAWGLFQAQPAMPAFEFDASGPRAAGMGGAGAAMSGDGWAALRNPALAANGCSLAGTAWSQQFGLPELTREEVAVVSHFRGHALGLTAATFGSQLYRESGFGLVWARALRPELCVGLDVGARWLEIEAYPSSQAISLTVGVEGRPLAGISVAAVWRNLNEPRLPNYRERIRASLSMGMAAQVTESGLVIVDIVQEEHFPAELRVGAEVRVLPRLTLRVGGRAEPVRPAAGFQVNVGRFSFVYAGDLHPDLGASHQVGFEIRLTP
jgi:hypothetical protein